MDCGKISVIIPVYNGEKYVAQCIENMLCQTYKNLEIIVINDGSTDNTEAIARQYPVQVVSQQNSGPDVARNRGIDISAGDYIHFMDVDDLINLDFYARMIDAIRLADADMACCEFVNEKNPHVSLRFSDRLLLTTAQDKMWATNFAKWGYAWRWFFKSSFLKENGLHFDGGRFYEDEPFSACTGLRADKIVTVPGAVYYYRNRENSSLNCVDRAVIQERKERRRISKANKKAFAREHDLSLTAVPVRKFKYKIFGIPMLTKTVYNSGKTSWYFFGIRVLRKKDISLL